jgi:hypothetical protein
MGIGYAYMSPPPPRGGIRTGKKRGWVPERAGNRIAAPARSVCGGYNPPLDVLLSAVLAADCMAEAAPDGEFDPARAPFTFW